MWIDNHHSVRYPKLIVSDLAPDPACSMFRIRIRIRSFKSRSNPKLPQKIINFIKLHYFNKNNDFLFPQQCRGNVKYVELFQTTVLYLILAWLKASLLHIYFRSGSETFISVPDMDPQHCMSRFTARPFQDQKRNICIFISRTWLDKRNKAFFREKSTNAEINSTDVRDNFCIFRQLLEATAYLHSNGKRSNSWVFFFSINAVFQF